MLKYVHDNIQITVKTNAISIDDSISINDSDSDIDNSSDNSITVHIEPVDVSNICDDIVNKFIKSANEYSIKSIKKTIPEESEEQQALSQYREAQHNYVSKATRKATDANVALIKDIPTKYMAELQDAISKRYSEGGNIIDIVTEERYKVAKSRVKVISRDQTNKVMGALNNARYLSHGITQGIWVVADHSNRLRKSHNAVNGKIFDLETGLLVDGEMVIPGQPILCRCDTLPVIPKD